MNDAQKKTTTTTTQTDRKTVQRGGADATTSTTKRALSRATSTSSCESFDGYVTLGDAAARAPVGRSRGWVRETREDVAGQSGSHLVRNARGPTSVDGRLDRSTPAFEVVKALLKAKRYDDALKAVD